MKELTREQVREVDRIAIEELGIPGIVLMENAGRNAAHEILDAFSPIARAVLFCGTGNNGGDGFVIARHLANAGVPVHIALAGKVEKLSPDAAVNYRICANMGWPIAAAESVELLPNDVVVDALLGTGFTSQVRAPLAKIIGRINAASKRAVVAIDVPSGLDCDTGQPSNATIQADMTVTFVAAKVGFSKPPAAEYTGQIVTADIGAPPSINSRVAQQ